MAPAGRCSRTSARARPKATTPSGPPGSPFSASPQQLAGEPARPADDIYGLGALAYELLSGYPPFYPAFDARKIATEPVPRLKPVKPIPPRLELLVSWMLAKQGRERPPSMRHVADEMNAVLQDTLGLESATAEAAEPKPRRPSSAPPRTTSRPPSWPTTSSRCIAPVRELDEIDPALLPQVDELRARAGARAARAAIGAATGSSPPCWCVVTGAVARIPAALAEKQKVDITTLKLPVGPTEAEQAAEKRVEELNTQHTELSKRAAGARFARRRAMGRRGIRRRAQDHRRDRRHARTAPVRCRAPRRSTRSRRHSTEIEARVPAALAAQISEGNRALAAGEFENARQAFDTALKIDPGNNEATEGSAKSPPRAAWCRRSPTRRTPKPPRTLPKAQKLFADVLKRNPGQRRGHRRPRARETHHGRQRIQRGIGRGACGAQRRPAVRSPHASRRGAQAAARQSRSRRRAATRGRHRLRPQPRRTRAARRAAGERRALDRGAGHLRRGPGARSVAAIRPEGPGGGCAARGTGQAAAGTHRQARTPGRGQCPGRGGAAAGARPGTCPTRGR